jgi:hypothetical protein
MIHARGFGVGLLHPNSKSRLLALSTLISFTAGIELGACGGSWGVAERRAAGSSVVVGTFFAAEAWERTRPATGMETGLPPAESMTISDR